MTGTAAPTKKKLPFKPTALRKAAAPAASPETDSDTVKNDGAKDEGRKGDLDLFNRRKEMEHILAADREREAAKRRKQKEAEERRNSGTKRRVDEDPEVEAPVDVPDGDHAGPADEPSVAKDDMPSELVTPPPSKRTRITPSSSKRRESPASQPVESPSARRSNTRAAAARGPTDRSPATPSGARIISLVSDDEDIVHSPTPTKLRDGRAALVEDIPSDTDPFAEEQHPGNDGEEEEDEEADEFAEYIRQAEVERKKRQKSQGAGAQGVAASSSSSAKVTLLVQSAIEGTKNCLILLYVDRPLVHVREAWVKSQQAHGNTIPVDPSDLILTWRRSKVYNYSTLHSLGIRPYGDGVVAEGFSTQGLAKDGSQVHMEIWTPDSFREWEESEEQRRRRAQEGESSDDDETDEEPAAPETKIKVVLRARDAEEVGLTVRPETTVETLITGYKATRGLEADTSITLWFDGDMLEEHVTMEDADIDDMDAIEVHVK